MLRTAGHTVNREPSVHSWVCGTARDALKLIVYQCGYRHGGFKNCNKQIRLCNLFQATTNIVFVKNSIYLKF